MAGATAEGFVVANEPVVYTVYRDAIHGARCAFADLLAPQPAKPRPGVRFRYRVRTGDHVIASGSLQPTQRRRIFMPLDFAGRRRIQFQQTSPDAVVLPAGQKLGLQVGNFDTLPGRCPKSSS